MALRERETQEQGWSAESGETVWLWSDSVARFTSGRLGDDCSGARNSKPVSARPTRPGPVPLRIFMLQESQGWASVMLYMVQ